MLILKKLNINKDITKKYRKWMNDKKVHQFSIHHLRKHTLKDIKKYVQNINISKEFFLYGIFLKQKNDLNHIGNIKIAIKNHHKTSIISYFIGEKQLWNKGYATKAIKQIIKIARKKKIKKIKAYVVEINLGSIVVVKKNGLKKEATLKSEELHGKKRYKIFIYSKIL